MGQSTPGVGPIPGSVQVVDELDVQKFLGEQVGPTVNLRKWRLPGSELIGPACCLGRDRAPGDCHDGDGTDGR
jgi:hypothetical protein